MSLSAKYNFSEIQTELEESWKKENVYKFQKNNDDIFSIDTPPPTISGSLHIGHIFSYCHTDFIARYMRMLGKNVFYPIGFDNNGLPTERLVEKKYKITAHKAEKKKFLQHCDDISKQKIEEFYNLFSTIGLSIDWGLQYSTNDKKCQHISQKSFIELYKKGLIYKEKTPTYWDTVDQTAIALAEVEEKEFSSFMNYIYFSTEEEQLTIATTRPELLPACVAVFFHPEDERYKHLEGEYAITPLFNQEIPIIADESVSIEKGTGLVMCCTFGDEMDINWQQKHSLPIVNIINKYGRISIKNINNPIITEIQDKKVKEAREIIIKKLQEKGLLKSQKEIIHNVKCAERSGSKLEIIPTEQWYLNILDHKKELLQQAKKIRWIPKKMFIRIQQWVEGLRFNWCISRQRYLGVPIPVWYKKDGSIVLPKIEELPINPQEKLPSGYTKEEVAPETDVLDTWATSSLTPQINNETLNNVRNTNNSEFLPMSLRPQAHEIIRTWAFYTIARSFLNENKIPWENIMISGWCLTSSGQKMSKSKADTVDPINLIEKYGCDVVRYWTASTTVGEDTLYSENTFLIGKKLVNKIWNAAKFVEQFAKKDFNIQKVTYPTDLWVINELNSLVKKIEECFNNFDYCNAKSLIETFFLKQYCDNYIEFIKARIYNEESPNQESAIHCVNFSFNIILKLFAPFLPYITDKIYTSIYSGDSIHASGNWPKLQNLEFKNEKILGEEAVKILEQVRKYKSEKNISIKHKIEKIEIKTQHKELKEMEYDIENACNVEKIIWNFNKDEESTSIAF